LIQAQMAVPLHQQTCTFSSQAKVLEFLGAILAGLPHLEAERKAVVQVAPRIEACE